ncbi:unnamed protein product [Euphydryas editha]|uniref:Uncharacterized protein n=1 Tax=Euphydryas editha TaxID=104508 RepID=A0AAU9TXN4_EUPED|nr:unnamed protein product [Euphydryas editha]
MFAVTIGSIINQLSNYFSKYTKIVRMTAWIFRFSHNARHKNKRKGELSFEESDEAEEKLIRIIQQEHKEQIEKQSGKSRQIYSDTDMIMRVNPFEAK